MSKPTCICCHLEWPDDVALSNHMLYMQAGAAERTLNGR